MNGEIKIQEMMLMHKLSAMCRVRAGQLKAVQDLIVVWQQFVQYWNAVYPNKHSGANPRIYLIKSDSCLNKVGLGAIE